MEDISSTNLIATPTYDEVIRTSGPPPVYEPRPSPPAQILVLIVSIVALIFMTFSCVVIKSTHDQVLVECEHEVILTQLLTQGVWTSASGLIGAFIILMTEIRLRAEWGDRSPGIINGTRVGTCIFIFPSVITTMVCVFSYDLFIDGPCSNLTADLLLCYTLMIIPGSPLFILLIGSLLAVLFHFLRSFFNV